MARPRLTIALALVACMLALPLTAAAGGPLRTAFNDNGDFDGPDAALAAKRMKAAGASAVRTPLDWYKVVPADEPAAWNPSDPNDPAYDWSYFDARVKLLKAHGLEPIAVFNHPPRWAGGIPDSPRPDLPQLAKFARAAAERYSGRTPGVPRVRYWQVWNEPNVQVFLYPQFRDGKPYAPTVYRSMVNSVGSAVHAVRADNLVIAGGLSPFTVTRGSTVTIGPLRFMRDMLCMSKGRRPQATCGGSAQFDIWAHHPYTSGGPTHHARNSDDVSLADLPEMGRLLRAAVAARHARSPQRVRFWVTEFSWDTSPPDPNGVPVRLHARWVSESLFRMWLAGVDLVAWLQLRDEPYPSRPIQSGLYFNGGSPARDKPKPALQAFRFPFVAFRGTRRTTVWGRTPTSTPGTLIVQWRSTGRWRNVAQLRANRYGIFTAKLRTPSTGWIRAKLVGRADASLAFSLAHVPDRVVRPFG
jgi:hypothetical protein